MMEGLNQYSCAKLAAAYPTVNHFVWKILVVAVSSAERHTSRYRFSGELLWCDGWISTSRVVVVQVVVFENISAYISAPNYAIWIFQIEAKI